MKLTKYFFAFTAAIAISLGMQSCFQDMEDDPAYDYPIGFPDPTGEYNRQKLDIPFDGDVYDQGTYQFLSSGVGTFSFPEGVKGKAYKGDADTTYILVQNHPAITKKIAGEITNLGSFTVAFWMNSPRNTKAIGMFSITNTKTFWSNLNILLENTSSESQAFFKVHLYNERTGTTVEKWVEARLDNTFGKWTHVAFVYNGSTSTLDIYKDGVKTITSVLTGLGELQFKDVGPIVIGTFPFQAKPSLTSGATNQGWAGWYNGSLDQLHFYSEPLSESEIVELYNDKN